MHEVGVEPVDQGNPGNRSARQRALGKHALLQLVVVSAARAPLGVFVGVHLTSLVDTILAGATAVFKTGWPDAYGAVL